MSDAPHPPTEWEQGEPDLVTPLTPVFKVVSYLPVNQEVLDDNSLTAEWHTMLADTLDMARMHEGQYHPHRMDLLRMQQEQARAKAQREHLRQCAPTRKGRTLRPGKWARAQPQSPHPDDFEPSCCGYCGSTTSCCCTVDEWPPQPDYTELPDDDLPGMWEHADFEGGQDYEVRGPDWKRDLT